MKDIVNILVCGLLITMCPFFIYAFYQHSEVESLKERCNRLEAIAYVVPPIGEAVIGYHKEKIYEVIDQLDNKIKVRTDDGTYWINKDYMFLYDDIYDSLREKIIAKYRSDKDKMLRIGNGNIYW